jgi:hypothetical protein
VSSRYRIGSRLLVRCPELVVTIPRVANLSQETVGLLRRPSPAVRVFEETGVLLEDDPGVVPADLAMDDVGDVTAATARAGNGIDQGERLLREGDVRADEPHRVTPSVNIQHTS